MFCKCAKKHVDEHVGVRYLTCIMHVRDSLEPILVSVLEMRGLFAYLNYSNEFSFSLLKWPIQ